MKLLLSGLAFIAAFIAFVVIMDKRIARECYEHNGVRSVITRDAALCFDKDGRAIFWRVPA